MPDSRPALHQEVTVHFDWQQSQHSNTAPLILAFSPQCKRIQIHSQKVALEDDPELKRPCCSSRGPSSAYSTHPRQLTTVCNSSGTLRVPQTGSIPLQIDHAYISIKQQHSNICLTILIFKNYIYFLIVSVWSEVNARSQFSRSLWSSGCDEHFL